MKTDDMYARAKRLIPGGTQLLSKRPELYLPGRWPAYYQRARGVELWDLDGRRFIDMSLTAIGACPLGYADPRVDGAVKSAIDGGTMTTLNCAEEVELAEKLCELHPWADQVRYARTGGEAMAIAVRIARAASGRDVIAVCGYHGWHDWYLAANLASDSNLDGHLLPGLDPAGVPRALAGTCVTFSYNRVDELEAAVSRAGDRLAAIVMEPVRYSEPDPEFLSRVRELASNTGASLVFDEITAAWRMNLGGAHLRFGIEPDVAVFGKALSNGYPMAAVIGRRDVMEAAQRTFISSTYWTERIGPTAALATIAAMSDDDVPAHLTTIGEHMGRVWRSLGERHGVATSTVGLPPLAAFHFDEPERAAVLGAVFTQRMLAHGFLAAKGFYATAAHEAAHVEAYESAADGVFASLRKDLDSGAIDDALDGPLPHTGFRRLA